MNKHLKDFLITSLVIIAALSFIYLITNKPPEVKTAFLETTNEETITVELPSRGTTRTIVETPTITPKPLPPKPVTHTHPKPKPIVRQPIAPVGEIQAYAKARSDQIFGIGHWNSLYQLWLHESGWEAGRVNPSSGAGGIPQALGVQKIYGYVPPMEWRNGKKYIINPDWKKEVEWGLEYIRVRKGYGNPTRAYQHFQRNNWY